jgi:NADH dehydrogenase
MKMIKLLPILPIPGEGRSRFQPVYIRDWMRCMSKVIDSPEKYPSTYDIGGPEHLTYTEMVEILSEVMGRKKPVFRIPMGLMKLFVSLLSKVFSSSPVTSDQLRLLEMDNISDLEAVERNFGFKPVRYKDALKDFIK